MCSIIYTVASTAIWHLSSPLDKYSRCRWLEVEGCYAFFFYHFAVRWYVTMKASLRPNSGNCLWDNKEKGVIRQFFGLVLRHSSRTFYEKLAPRGVHQDGRHLQTSNKSNETTKSSSLKWWKDNENYTLIVLLWNC